MRKNKQYNMKKKKTIETKKTKKEIVKMLLNTDLQEQDEEELLDLLIDQPIAIDVDKQEEAKMTFSDRIADKVSEVCGSWTFIIVFMAFLIGWIILNSVILLGDKSIDLKSELILESLHDQMEVILRNQKRIFRYIETGVEEDSESK